MTHRCNTELQAAVRRRCGLPRRRGQRAGQLRRVRDHRRDRPERARAADAAATGFTRPVTTASTSARSATSVTPTTLAARLAERGLGLAGGYLELPFSEPDKLTAALPELEALLDIFDTRRDGRARSPSRRSPMPARRLARATRAARPWIPSVGLDDAGWERVRRRAGPAPWSAAASAAMTRPSTTTPRPTSRPSGRSSGCSRSATSGCAWTPGTCCSDAASPLDGHPRLGAIGSIRCISRTRAWHGSRRSSPRPRRCEEIWRRQAFCALGDGDIDIASVLEALAEIGYTGWLVVEQDVLPDPANPQQPAEDQRRNREYLRASMASEPVRIALVGAGRMGSVHLEALQALRGDRAGRRRRAGRRAGPGRLAADGLVVYESVDELLARPAARGRADRGAVRPAPDVGGARSPPRGSRCCARSRWGSASGDAAEAAAAPPHGAGVLLQVGYWRRFVPELRALRERIAAGELGEDQPAVLHAVGRRAARRAVPRPTAAGSPSTWACTSSTRRAGCWARSSSGWRRRRPGRAGTTQPAPIRTPRRSSPQLSGGAAATISLGRRFPHEDSCWLEMWGTEGYERVPFMWDTAGDEVFRRLDARQAEAFARAVRGGPVRGRAGRRCDVAALTVAERVERARCADRRQRAPDAPVTPHRASPARGRHRDRRLRDDGQGAQLRLHAGAAHPGAALPPPAAGDQRAQPRRGERRCPQLRRRACRRPTGVT